VKRCNYILMGLHSRNMLNIKTAFLFFLTLTWLWGGVGGFSHLSPSAASVNYNTCIVIIRENKHKQNDVVLFAVPLDVVSLLPT